MRKNRLSSSQTFRIFISLFSFFTIFPDSLHAFKYNVRVKTYGEYLDSTFSRHERNGILLLDSAVRWRVEDFESIGDYGYRVSAEPFFNISNRTASGNGAFDFTHRKIRGKNTFYTDGSSRFSYSFSSSGKDNMFPVQNTGYFLADVFGQAGFDGNMARFTYDRYIDKKFLKKPNFLFVEPQLELHYDSDPLGLNAEKMVSEGAVSFGYGVGRIYPTAIYDRAVRFFEVLYQNGLLKRKPTQDELKHLMSVLPNRWRADFETFKALNELRLMGLLESEVSFGLAERLRDEIAASRDYVEYGEEIRTGFNFRTFGVNLPYVSLEQNAKKNIPFRFFIEYKRIFNFDRLIISTGASFYLQFQQLNARLNGNAGATYVFSDKMRANAFYHINLDAIRNGTRFSTGITVGVSYVIGNYLSASFHTSLDFARGNGVSFGLSLRFSADAY